MDIVYNKHVTVVEDDGPWHVKFTPITRTPKSFFEETCTATELMWSQRSGKTHVLFSGGLDTEYLLSVMVHLKMNPTVVVLKFVDIDNEENVKRVVHFCEANHLSYYRIDVSVTGLIEDISLLEVMSKVRCSDYRLLPLFWAASTIGETVFANIGSPASVKFNNHLRGFVVQEHQSLRSAYNLWDLYKVNGTPFALSYTSEQLTAFLCDPVTMDYTSDRNPSVKNLDEIKSSIYNSTPHFNLGLRKKFYPFERYKPPQNVQRIMSLNCDAYCDYDFHKLKYFLRGGNLE